MGGACTCFYAGGMAGSGGRRETGSGEGFPSHFQKVQKHKPALLPAGKWLAGLACRSSRSWANVSTSGVDVGHLETGRPEHKLSWATYWLGHFGQVC